MKSRVTISRPELDQQTGNQKSWTGQNGKPNFDSYVVFEDGSAGLNSCQTAGPNPYFIVGQEVEYEKKPGGQKNDGTQWPDKIQKPRTGFAGVSKEWKPDPYKNRGIALSYANAAWIGGVLEKKDIAAYMEWCVTLMEKDMAPPLQAQAIAQAPVAVVNELPVTELPEDDLPF